MGISSVKRSPADIIFGPPYAIVNLSKAGLRYFRIGIHCSAESREILIKQFADHPNVGWIFSAEGWFTLAVGLWARDNAEINDVSSSIRAALGKGDEVVFQSELTGLYAFPERPRGTGGHAVSIVDAVQQPVDLTPLELDCIKILTLDYSLSDEELGATLGISTDQASGLKESLERKGVVVGIQNRINYDGHYFKVFVDTSSRQSPQAAEKLTTALWHDQHCIYIEKANGKYDLEFELILDSKDDIATYLTDFSDVKTAILTQNLYTNLFPLNKTANLREITSALIGQTGPTVDLRNSKLWYLSHSGAKAYLHVYEDKNYAQSMQAGEQSLFPTVTAYLQETYPETRFNIIDIGSGDGQKARQFIDALGSEHIKAYYPVDIQPIELAAALQAHESSPYAKHPTLIPIENLASRFPLSLPPSERQIYLFFGGTYGNYPSGIINKYLSAVLGPSTDLLIAMPIFEQLPEESIIESYSSTQLENMAFGPLGLVGFKKTDFEPNPKKKNLIIQPIIEDQRLVTTFILAQDTKILSQTFRKGTVFKMTTSWKPTRQQFLDALATNFALVRTFENNSFSIAAVRAK